MHSLSQPRWLGQRGEPQSSGERQAGHNIFAAENPPPGSLVLLSTSGACFSSSCLCHLRSVILCPWASVSSLTELEWDFLCGFSQLAYSLTIGKEVADFFFFLIVVDIHSFSQRRKNPFIYLGHLRKHNACPQAEAKGWIKESILSGVIIVRQCHGSECLELDLVFLHDGG